MNSLLRGQNPAGTVELKFRKLLTEINLSSHDTSSLETLRHFEKFDLKSEEIYTFLEETTLSHRNDKIRYIASKLIYKNYPEKSSKLIKELLSHDSNYKIRIFNLTESKRYNFNELVNLSIKQIRNKDKMVEDIIKYNFTEFVLLWKDYLDLFNVFYNIDLKCFILNFRNSQEVAYFCNRISDPFYSLRVGSILNKNKMHYLIRNSAKIRIVMDFLRRFLHVKNADLKALALKPEQEEILPNFRIFCDISEFFVYLHL